MALESRTWHISSHESNPSSVWPALVPSLTINLISPAASINGFGIHESCLGPRWLLSFSVARPSWTTFHQPGLSYLFKWDSSGSSDTFPVKAVPLLGRSQLGACYFSGRKYSKAIRWSWKEENTQTGRAAWGCGCGRCYCSQVCSPIKSAPKEIILTGLKQEKIYKESSVELQKFKTKQNKNQFLNSPPNTSQKHFPSLCLITWPYQGQGMPMIIFCLTNIHSIPPHGRRRLPR